MQKYKSPLKDSRVHALLGYFNFQFFGTVLESTDFLVELKVDIVNKLSTSSILSFKRSI